LEKLKIERKTHRKNGEETPVARPKELSFENRKKMKLEIGIKTLNQKPFVFKKSPKEN
jgi:hypothetical protein